MRINFNVNREYDSYLPPISTVSNSESFEASTSDTKLSKASSSEISSEDEKYFERTMTADKAESVFQQPLSSTFTRMRSWYRSIKRSLMVKCYAYGFLEIWFKKIRKLYFIKRQKCLTKSHTE